ncbi:WxL domain-containing protein [Lactobacillus sp. CC-MHH1034]|nr:WxL domain-containing protein [Agrilactobacillus fermenti]
MMTRYKRIKLWLLMAIVAFSGGLLLLLGVGSVYGADGNFNLGRLSPSFETGQTTILPAPPNQPSSPGAIILGIFAIPGFSQQPAAIKSNYYVDETVNVRWNVAVMFRLAIFPLIIKTSQYTIWLYHNQTASWDKVVDKRDGSPSQSLSFNATKSGTYLFQVEYYRDSIFGLKQDSYSQLFQVNVNPRPVPATGLAISDNGGLFNGVSSQLHAVTTPTDSTATIKNWHSDNPDLAITNQNGATTTATGTLKTDTDMPNGVGDAETATVTVDADNTGMTGGMVHAQKIVKIGGLDPLTVDESKVGSQTPIVFAPYGLSSIVNGKYDNKDMAPTYQWGYSDKDHPKTWSTAGFDKMGLDATQSTLQFKNVKQANRFSGDYFQLQVTIRNGGLDGTKNHTIYSNRALLTVNTLQPKQLTMISMPNLKFVTQAGTNVAIADLVKNPVTLVQAASTGATSGTENNNNQINISDNRATVNGWRLSLKMVPFHCITKGQGQVTYGSNSSGGLVTLKLNINNQAHAVKDNGQDTVVCQQAIAGDLNTVIKGAQLIIQPAKNVYAGQYQTQLTWTASSVPPANAPQGS